MAKIYAMPDAAEWAKKPGEDFDAYMVRERKLLDALSAKAKSLKPGEYKGAIIKFSVADGYAMYHVLSMKPLVLCHVPYGDAYRAHGLIEKGLNVAEVKKMVDRDREFDKMFAGRA